MSALRLFSPVDMDASYFLNRLYPLQDKVLQVIDQAQTGLYLTGGTALSRGYLNHRFSDDLDLFANMDERFGTWCSQVQNALSASSEWSVRVQRQAGAFLRLIVTQSDVELKI